MPKAVTGTQAIRNMVSQPSQWTLGTVIETNVLARDKNNVILTSSRIVTVNYHGIGGLGRVELPTGIDPTNVSVNDDLLVLQQNGRALAVQHYPASNRTAAGSGGMGQTLALEKYSSDITVVGTIVGNQLELLWNPVPRAEYYQIWTSPTGDPSIDDATYVANSPSTSWVSKRDGIYFDDGMWYAVMAQHSNGQAGTLSPWVQPTFGGNYATGMLSQNQTTSIPGSLIVALSGSIVRATFTSVDSPTTFDVDVADPMAAHSGSPLFANGDILQFTDTSGNKLWVTVVSSTDETTFWRYTVTKEDPSAGTNYTILTGSSVVDWGQSGQGVFIVSADGTFGPGTLWQIVTHTGTPWVSFTVQVYADSTGKVISGGGADVLDSNGLSITVGTGVPNKIKFISGATTISEIYEFYSSPTQSILTLSDNVGNTLASGGVLMVAEDSAGHGVVLGITQDASGGYVNAYNTSGTFVGVLIGGSGVPTVALQVVGEIRNSYRLRTGGSTTGYSIQNAITNLANNGTIQVAVEAAPNAMIIIQDSAGLGAIFSLRGGVHSTVLQSAGGGYTITAATGGNTNVYWSGANSWYELENKSGGTRSYQIWEFAVA